jgi:NTP pyrophosphatase (non-canonical NTP hydrolase)
MKFSDYQQQAIKTALYPKVEGHGWIYPALGLANEAGEVTGKLKKVLRDNNGVVDDERRKDIAKELGDVLWYVAQVATELEIDLDEVAEANISKLASRQERGVLGGNGDNR